MDLAVLERLVAGEGWGLLESLPPYDESSALRLAERLRGAGFDADLVAGALTQSRLRARGRDKFGEFAAGMLFTDDGLEQATRLEVAARHAERFRRAGVRQVFDLGCGIGSDAMACAGLDLRVTAVDADPAAALVAGVNLRHWPSAATLVRRAEDVRLPAGEGARHAGAWLDPARRVTGVADATGRTKRVFRLDAISPSWTTVQQVAASLPAVGAKLCPSLPHGRVPAGTEAEWTSYRGEVLECVVWWGGLVRRPGRRALVIGSDGKASSVTEADASSAPPPLADLGRVDHLLYEPDRAVIRAGLTGALCTAVDGAELDAGVGYVSSGRAVELPWARRFVVEEAMPWGIKRLRAYLRDRGVGRLTVKKRGVTVDADQLRRQLHLRGDVEATVVITRVAGRQVALVVRPT